MKAPSELLSSPLQNQSGATRREFLKSSFLGSVATAAVGVSAMAEDSEATAKTETKTMISVSGATPSAPLRKPWKSAVATGYAPLHLRADLQQHLATLQREIGYGYCRFHGIFHDDMGVVARRSDGSLAFRWAQVDKVYDSLLELGLRPRVELSSMPIALASGAKTVFDWDFNVTPPRDYSEWGQLVGAFARHCVDRYGHDEVAQWYFEVWNEPNINFWSGTQDDYWKLYDVSAAALKAVSPRLRVGGPVSAHAGWVAEMIARCSAHKSPLDFISTHIYPQDEWTEYPDLRGTPHSPGMYVADVVQGIRQIIRQSPMPDLELHITEWNTISPVPGGQVEWSHSPTLDNASAAATVCDLALAVDGDCDAFCWWEASDVFAESGMPLSEFSGEYGLLTLNGISKATFNAFRFLNRLRGCQLHLRHEPLAPGCNVVATAEGESLHALLWYRDLSVYGVTEPRPWTGILQLPWSRSSKPLLLQERITAGAGSCYETWQAMGAPENVSLLEHRVLEAHSTPEARVFRPDVANNQVTNQFRLAPGEVLYLELRPQDEIALPTQSGGMYRAHRRKPESAK